MDLAQLFVARKAFAGSTRDMAERAAAAGYPLSHTQFGKYARGDVPALPSEHTRRAIAAALFPPEEQGHAFAEVTAAALKSVAPEASDGLSSQHAIAFLRLTEGRTAEEIRTTLGAVEGVLRAIDLGRQAASREAARSNPEGPDAPNKS